MDIKKILVITMIATLVPAAAAALDEITLQELQDNMSLLLPEAESIEGLSYHGNWQEMWHQTNAYGIEAEYEALYDENYAMTSERPKIYTYIMTYASEESVKSAITGFQTDDNFDSGEWTLISTNEDGFSYKTGPGYGSDIFMNYTSESGTLHYVTSKENLLIVVNFYREGGEYNRGNVLAYEEYLVDTEGTLEVLKSASSYIKEAIDFYLDDIDPIGAPDGYQYYLPTAGYSTSLNNIYALPQSGSIQFDMYLDDTSEIGTILDSAGVDDPVYGDIKLALNENAILDFNLYNPFADSACSTDDGWNRIYSQEGIDLYEWTTVKIEYGIGTGMRIYINDRLQEECDVQKTKSDRAVYLGDYPDDIIEQSFVGYIKDISTNYGISDSVISEYEIFADVIVGDKYSEAIAYLKTTGIIGGYADGSFGKSNDVNRAEIVKMLLLGFDFQVPEYSGDPRFPDVETGAWYEKYVMRAHDLGFISGYPNGYYGPAESVNKVEFLKILTMTYGIDVRDTEVTELYNDTDKDEWYAQYVQFSKNNGLMDADSEGNFYPDNNVTRGEVAETIYRLINLY